MKKVFLTVMLLCFFGISNAQVRFGVKAGLLSSSYDGYRLHRDDKGVYYDDYYYDYYGYGYGNGYSANTSKVGVYLGGLVEMNLVDKFKLQPELTLTIVPNKDLGYIAVNVPVLVKYSFFDKFYAMAGPAANFAVDGDDDQFSPSFDLGASYDIMQDFYVEVRGDIGLSGYLGSTVNAGVGYRF